MRIRFIGMYTLIVVGAFACLSAWPVMAAERVEKKVLAPLPERFSASADQGPGTDEVPNFQRHVSPLLGRLGCNGRACHGSFQGQGGFQLSLFGYDFEADHRALMEDGTARVDLDERSESLILTKPVDADLHDGGKRYEQGSWQYWVLRNWIDAGAPYQAKQVQKLERLVVTPSELRFAEAGQQKQLKAVAHWEDGTVEDVTCLCRFQSNDSAIASIDEAGQVTSAEAGDTHVVVSYDKAVVPVLALRPVSDRHGDAYPALVGRTKIDRLVLQKLRKLGIAPSDVCSDEEFLRRASLDATGTLPSADEVVAFVADRSEGKRAKKIDQLLSRPGYAAQWTTFLCDITGNNEDQLRNFLPQQTQPSNQWYQWIYQRVEQNVPYDQLVEGIVTATSRLPDESYGAYCEAMSDVCRDPSGTKFAERPGLVHYWARNNFRTAEERAIGFAYSFLGVRIQCAQCHKHPFDQWSKSDFDNFERLFGGVQARQNSLAPDAKKEFTKMVSALGLDKKLKGNQLRRELGGLLKKGKVVPLPELVVAAPRNNNRKKGGQKSPAPKAKLLGGEWVAMDQMDVRGTLMDWLRSPDNPYFAKAIVNRVWAQYLGVGIVNPVDDLNLANAPSNQRLLDYLATGFIESGYDLKWLHREILNSDTYQRSWIPNDSNRQDKMNFSHSQLRRLSAESTYDAVRMALANDKFAEQARELQVPRAITKAGASARSNQRDDQSYALSVFGRSIRESNCDCDRSSEPSLLQTVFLINDSAVQDWLGDSKTSWVSEVASKFDWPAGRKSPAQQARARQITEALTRFVNQVREADQRIEAAEAAGQARQVTALEKRRSEILKRARAAAKKNGVVVQLTRMLDGQDDNRSSSNRMTEEQAMWVAEHAYLRTLSRTPNSEELSRVVQFLQADNSPVDATEGLMWSLINTKEFILNH